MCSPAIGKVRMTSVKEAEGLEPHATGPVGKPGRTARIPTGLNLPTCVTSRCFRRSSTATMRGTHAS